MNAKFYNLTIYNNLNSDQNTKGISNQKGLDNSSKKGLIQSFVLFMISLFFWKKCIGVQLFYKVLLVSTLQQSRYLYIYIYTPGGTSLVAQMVKPLPTIRETQVQSLGREDLLEKEMATHSSILAWKIPWMEEHGRLQSMGSHRVRHDWATSLSFFLYTYISFKISFPFRSL